VIHRDIKPENILIVENNSTGQLVAKLLDFGLSKYSGMGSAAKSFVGTPCYVAPEIEAASQSKGRTYGSAVDCWSLGAVLYVMLVARFPEFQYIGHAKTITLPFALWSEASEESKHLVRGLMHSDPHARLSANAVLRHPWLQRVGDVVVDEDGFGSGVGVVYDSSMPPPPGLVPTPTTPATTFVDTASTTVQQEEGQGNCPNISRHNHAGGEVMTMVLHPKCAPKIRNALEASKKGELEPACGQKFPLQSLLMLQK
jgi:serine/threonine protein kinase